MHTPNVHLQRVVDAASEPISLDDAKGFLLVEIDDDDALISDMITAARLWCENEVDRSFVSTQWMLTLDYFPPYAGRWSTLLPPAIVGPMDDRNYWLNLSDNAIQFPYPPLISVDSCTYIDTAGNLQTLDLSPGARTVSIVTGTPGQMTPYFGTIFPVTQPQLGAVNIAFTAGNGGAATAVPASVRMAIRFLIALYYEHRTIAVDVPDAIRRVLDPCRWGA